MDAAGFGARLAMGCNRGFLQWAFHSSHFTPGVLQAATAIACLRRTLHAAACLQNSGNAVVLAASPLTQRPDQVRRRFRLGMLVFIGMVGWALLTAWASLALGLAMPVLAGLCLAD